MSALSIDAVNVPVRAVGGATKTREDLGRQERSHAGYLRSDVTAGRGRATSWAIETPPLTGSELTAVRAALAEVGSVSANGTLFASTATPCLIRALSEEPDRNGYVVFRFTLHVIATA